MSLKKDKVQIEIVVKADKTRTEISKLEKEANLLSRQLKKLPKDSQEFIEKSKQYNQVKNRIADLRKTIDITGMTMRELRNRQRELNLAMLNMDPRNKKYKELQGELTKVNNRMRELRTGTTSTGFSLSKMANNFNKYAAMMGAFSLSVVGLIMQMRKATDAFSSFEKAVSSLSALTGLTGDKLKWLEDQAKELSTSVLDGNIKITKSAEEIVNAYTKVGSKMPELLSDQEALNEVTKNALILAEAGNIDLDVAVNSLTNTMNQFRLPANQAAEVINLIAAGAKYGAADIDYVGNSIVRFGAAANAMNVSTTESVALVEALAKGGLDAEKAGTGLKTFLLRSGQQADEFNVQVVGLSNVLENLADANLSAAEMAKMFGTEGYVAAQTLVTNVDVYDDLMTKIEGTATATEMASINTDNHAATMAQAKNDAKNLSIEIGEKLAPHLVFSTNVARKFLVILTKLPQILRNNKELLIGLGSAILIYNGAKIKSSIILLKDNILMQKGIGLKIIEYAQLQKNIYQENLAALSKTKLAASNNFLIQTYIRLRAVIMMNPWGALAAGVIAATAAVVAFSKSKNKLNEEFVQTRTEIIKEQTALDGLFERLRYAIKTQGDRAGLIKQINEQYGDYLPFLLNEKSSLDDIAKAQKIANDEIERGILIKSKQAQQTEILSSFADEAAKSTERILKRLQEGWGLLPEQAQDLMKSINDVTKTGVENRKLIDKVLHESGISYGTATAKQRQQHTDLLFDIFNLTEAYREKDASMGDLDNTYNSLITSTGKLAGEMSGLEKEIAATESQLNIELSAEIKDKDLINSLRAKLNELRKQLSDESTKEKIDIIDDDDFTPDPDKTEEKLNEWVNKYLDAEVKLHIAYKEDMRKQKEALDNKQINQETYLAMTQQLHSDYMNELADMYAEEKDDDRFSIKAKVELEDLSQEEIMKLHEETLKQLEQDKQAREDRITSILDSERYMYEEKLEALRLNLELEFITQEEYEAAVAELKISQINKVRDHFEMVNQEVIGKVYSMMKLAQQAYYDREYTLVNNKYNEELNNLNNLFESKRISEEEFNERKQALDEKKAQDEKEIRRVEILNDANMQKAAIGMESAQTLFKIGAILATQIASQRYGAAAISGVQMGLVVADSAMQIGAVNAARDRAISELAVGQYPLIGESGRNYNLDSINNKPKTGIGNRPTHYIAHEKGPEMIIDYPTLRNIQLNAPNIIDNIMSMRVPERAEGQYPTETTPANNNNADISSALLNEMINKLASIDKKLDNTYSFKDLYDRLQKVEKQYDKINEDFAG